MPPASHGHRLLGAVDDADDLKSSPPGSGVLDVLGVDTRLDCEGSACTGRLGISSTF
jgi:hypothetical protein